VCVKHSVFSFFSFLCYNLLLQECVLSLCEKKRYFVCQSHRVYEIDPSTNHYMEFHLFRIYPSLNGFESKDSYGSKEAHFPMEETMKHSETMAEDEQMGGLPFLVAASSDRMLASSRANRTLIKTFFDDDDGGGQVA